MYMVFYSTNNVFRAEEMLNKSGIACSIVPTPVMGKAYCGVCIKTVEPSAEGIIKDMEYELIDD